MDIQINKNYVWADYLRVFATISVIVTHGAGNALQFYGTSINSDWWVSSTLVGITRFCVPMFMMLTGALLLPKESQLNDFLNNKFSRIMLPFLFWSAVYIAFEVNARVAAGGYLSFKEVVTLTLTMLKNGSAYHLWYIYVIIGIYLFIPILGKWLRNSTEQEILYFLVIWFFVMMLNQPYIIAMDIRPSVDFTYFSGFLGYLVLGYYLSIKRFKNLKRTNVFAIILLLGGNLATVFGYYYTAKEGTIDNLFYGYLTPNVMAVAIGTFILFRNYSFSKPKSLPVISFIGRYSYGIYLVHILVMSQCDKFGWYFSTTYSAINIPANTVVYLVISTVIIYVLNKIPFINKFAG